MQLGLRTDIGNMIGLTGTNTQMVLGISIGVVGQILAPSEKLMQEK